MDDCVQENLASYDPGAPWPGSFSEPVRRWFEHAFASPTPVQARAWTAISNNKNALVIAPTGSGKTLAAFLFAIDRIITEKSRCSQEHSPWEPGVRILYISPLKALGADVQRNLDRPLSDIAAMAQNTQVTTAMRTGDSTADERRRISNKPPDILITTPESLYLMLTSQASRVLRTVETVIVDEVHSIAGSKRGAHLSLSLERLDDLLEHPAQRIGLSATVRPRDRIARFLGGTQPVEVVAEDAPPALDLSVCAPIPNMAAIPAFGGRKDFAGFNGHGDPLKSTTYHGKGDPLKARAKQLAATSPDTRSGSMSIWPYLEAEVLDQVLSHRSTIVFVNSRGLCERFTARLNERYAERIGQDAPHSESAGWWSDAGSATSSAPPSYRSDMGSSTEMSQGAQAVIAKAHHGSVAKQRRREIERELKAGELPCVVATSSLELGIDMGEVDLVIQIAPPLSVSSGLQRVGRANHQVGGRSVGRIYPRMRTELVDAAVMAQGMETGAIEETRLVENALDVLAQQTVAAVAVAPEGLDASQWLATVRRSACFTHLGQNAYESTLDMLAGRYESGELAAFSPRIIWDRREGLLKPRPQSQRLAVSNAGTIPDRGMYSVVLPEGDGKEGRRRVGELDEEMVHESRVGDIIALGTSTWRITEIGPDRVMVQPAPGRSARLPFWHGDAPARPAETGYARGAFLRRAAAALPDRPSDSERPDDEGNTFDPPFDDYLATLGFDRFARENLCRLLVAQRAATEALPTDRTLVVEQCQDETGDWRLVLHSPFGRQVHEPWALAIAHRASELWGFDAQASAGDDGILLRIPLTAETIPGAELFCFDPDEIDLIVRQLVGTTSLFAARFRECAARALLTSAAAPGKRTPLWQQRLQGSQLLDAARQQKGFPLLAEAMRECLTDAFDMEALRRVTADICSGSIVLHTVRTPVPSPLASALIFGYVGEHIYDGDLPRAERRASLLAVDQAVLSELLGAEGNELTDLLDSEVVERLEANLQHLSDHRKLRGTEGAFDLLRELGPLSVDDLAQRLVGNRTAAETALAELQAQRRAFPASWGSETRWIAADDAPRLSAVLTLELPGWVDRSGACTSEHPLDGLVARFARTHSLWTLDEAAAALGVGIALVGESVERLSASQRVVTAGRNRWADFDVLKRLRTASLAAARAAVQPVSPQAFTLQLLRRQAVAAASEQPPLVGLDGVAWVLSQFEGVYLPLALWENVVLPARVSDWRPAMLGDLMAEGELIWVSDAQRRIAFFPTDSPLAPLPLNALNAPDHEQASEPGETDDAQATLAKAVKHCLAAEGPLTFAQLTVTVAKRFPELDANDDAVGRTLIALTESGQTTSDELGLPRSDREQIERALDSQRHQHSPSAAGTFEGRESASQGLRRASSRRTSHRYQQAKARSRASATAKVLGRSALQEALSGHWSLLLPSEASSTEQALGAVESLLDRYGVISRDIALAAGIPGGLDALLPVLQPMERSGEVARGMFVDGFGPLQFAAKETVDELRRIQEELDENGGKTVGVHGDAAVLDSSDPANLFGAGVSWPEVCWSATKDVIPVDSALPSAKPSRRDGSFTVLVEGMPVLWAAPNLKGLLLFTADNALISRAIDALAQHLQKAAKQRGSEASRAKLVVETVNACPVHDTPYASLLQKAGFARLPNGMRLYLNPF